MSHHFLLELRIIRSSSWFQNIYLIPGYQRNTFGLNSVCSSFYTLLHNKPGNYSTQFIEANPFLHHPLTFIFFLWRSVESELVRWVFSSFICRCLICFFQWYLFVLYFSFISRFASSLYYYFFLPSCGLVVGSLTTNVWMSVSI